jgi:hypothetical protein
MTKYKYLLTFDIGIKNLAYCIIRYNILDKKNFDIIYWGILDISYKGLICNFNIDISKKNNIAICCTNNSYLYLPNDKNDKETKYTSYCKFHSNKIKNNNITLYNKLKKIANNAKLKDNFNQQVERLLIELDKFYYQFIDTIYDIDNKIISYLDIYIENQPVLKNPIMKSISIVLFAYFNMKKIKFSNKIKSVNFVSATVKTKANLYNNIKQNFILNTKLISNNNYQNRKQYCIDIAKDVVYQLNNSFFNAVAISIYEFSKKKDDLADTLLYVLYVLLN